MWFWKTQPRDLAAGIGQAPTLAVAAGQASAIALTEKLPLAAIARQDPLGTVHWFAENILSQTAVYGKNSFDAPFKRLAKGTISSLTMSATGITSDGFVELRVPRAELKRYLAWLRTVQ